MPHISSSSWSSCLTSLPHHALHLSQLSLMISKVSLPDGCMGWGRANLKPDVIYPACCLGPVSREIFGLMGHHQTLLYSSITIFHSFGGQKKRNLRFLAARNMTIEFPKFQFVDCRCDCNYLIFTLNSNRKLLIKFRYCTVQYVNAKKFCI
jgi:hypothetical protein